MDLSNEAYIKKLIFESQMDDLVRNDEFVEKLAKKLIDNRASKKEIEKYVRDIVAQCANSLFKSLWMKRDFYEREIKTGF